MGFADYIKNMLRPMGVYRLDRGYGASEIEAIGDSLDKINALLTMHLVGCNLKESSGDYLSKIESLFPIVNFADGESERRENVLTLMMVNENFSDKASLEKILSACGLKAEICETDEKFVLELHFEDIRGELSDTEAQVCKSIMPAHTVLKFICDGLTWDSAEARFPTWDDFDNCGLTAHELVKLQ